MKKSNSKATAEKDLQARYDELQLTCRLWMAVADAKDARIAELEDEVAALSRRASRLGRRAERTRSRTTGPQPLRRTPTAG